MMKKIGDTLANGAIIIAIVQPEWETYGVILAWWGSEYVVWMLSPCGGVYNGLYTKNILHGAQGFTTRVKQ